MRRFSIRLRSIFLVILSLFLVTTFFERKNASKSTENALSYNYLSTYESDVSYIETLGSGSLEGYYNLADHYPLVSEAQKKSDFCWIYSSMKALESAFMVQLGEYYNFSEVGLAYLFYMSKLENNGAAQTEIPDFNCDGDFDEFVEAYQNNGLILESDFSIDNFEEIDACTDKNYYSYVSDYATMELNSYIKPYKLYNKSSPYWQGNETKRDTLKRFIKKYGAVFAGVEGGNGKGCLYKEDNETTSGGVNCFYDDDRTSHGDNPLSGPHAVAVVGWNDDVIFGADKGAFLVMNSWGFGSNSMSFFYVPYSYDYIYGTFAGFICETPDEPEIKLVGSGDSSFASDILNSSSEIKNYFCYDDEILVTYKLNLSSLEYLKIKVSSGNRDYTNIFNVSHDNENKKVSITLNKSSTYYGGYYTISFYDDDTLLGKRGLFVYSGTEIGGFLVSSAVGVEDCFALNNAFLNNNSTVTLNLSSGYDYYSIKMNLAPITNYSRIVLKNSNKKNAWKGFEISISDVSIVCSTNTSLETNYTSLYLQQHLFLETTNSSESNLLALRLGTSSGLKLSNFSNCLIQFKLSFSSVVYSNCARDYYFNVFVSNVSGAKTQNLNEVTYVLNGGENNAKNLTKYPKYSTDTTISEVQLLSPTKVGSSFVGWYLNADFSGSRVYKFDNSLSGNVTLYARWDSIGIDYFDINFVCDSVVDYNNTEKSLTEAIVYGDTVRLKLAFIENSLNNLDYTINYFIFLDEIEVLSGDKAQMTRNNSTLSVINECGFPILCAGSHVLKVRVNVVIAGSLELTEQSSLSLSVEKKNVSFGFNNTEKTYDGSVLSPDVVLLEDFYAEDKEGKTASQLYTLYCDRVSKNAGTYNYSITNILNSNYTYNANQSRCTFNIAKRGLNFSLKPYSHVYNGLSCFPEFDVTGKVAGDSVTYSFLNEAGQALTECKDAKEYKIKINSASLNQNYKLADESAVYEFKIDPSRIRIVLHATLDRVQTEASKRKQPTFSVYGNYYSLEDLDIEIATEAKTATRSGKYPISCRVNSSNYYVESTSNATYTLTGYYYVYYRVSNGETYAERVEENKLPKGLNKDMIDVPKFSKISYSNDYLVTGQDIYVQVTIKDYSAFAMTGIFVGVFGLICLIYFLKKRESKVR